jgi:hypothetical protein
MVVLSKKVLLINDIFLNTTFNCQCVIFLQLTEYIEKITKIDYFIILS